MVEVENGLKYCFMNNQAGLICCVSYDKVEVENGLYTKRVKRNCRPLGILTHAGSKLISACYQKSKKVFLGHVVW